MKTKLVLLLSVLAASTLFAQNRVGMPGSGASTPPYQQRQIPPGLNSPGTMGQNRSSTQPGTVNANGTVNGGNSTVNPNGTVINPNGTTVYPNGTTVYPNGMIVYPNGTTVNAGVAAPNTMNSVNNIPTNPVPRTIPQEFTNRTQGFSTWITNQPRGIYPAPPQ